MLASTVFELLTVSQESSGIFLFPYLIVIFDGLNKGVFLALSELLYACYFTSLGYLYLQL